MATPPSQNIVNFYRNFVKKIFFSRHCVKLIFFISFTLYPTHSRVGRGNLVLRHRILEVLRVEWQNSTPRVASTPERRNGNINSSKYFISSSGDRTHNQSVLQSHFVSLCHDWPRIFLDSVICEYIVLMQFNLSTHISAPTRVTVHTL